jgi:endoglucanase
MTSFSCQAGVNLGGWISQYKQYDPQHFETFIHAEDIQRIADWGMDHVRLPVDYPVLEEDAHPLVYKASGFKYLERCLGWCKDNGLRVILDLHKAPGYSFADTIEGEKPMPLFYESHAQERFLNLWGTLAERYKTEGDTLLFELLNEINLPDCAPWNNLAQQTVARIRSVDVDRQIVIGGNHFNAASELANIRLLNDPNIVYTFHFYEPILFTHQKAPWSPVNRFHNTSVEYPGTVPGLEKLFASHPEQRPGYEHFIGLQMDENLLRQYLQPVLDFIQTSGHVPYCGEYGVIETASESSRLNWHRDFIGLLRQHGIGRAIWSYKGMGFGLVDWGGRVVSEKLVQIVSEQ